MHYNFGISFNCYFGDFGDLHETGDGETPTIDFVGDDLDKIEQHILTNSFDGNATASRTHEYVGQWTDLGGSVSSVILDRDKYVACIIFEDPSTSEVEVIK